MKFKKCISATVAVALIYLSLTVNGIFPVYAKSKKTVNYGTLVKEAVATVSNSDGLTLSVDSATGTVVVEDRLSGKIWQSNFKTAEEDKVAFGVNNENVRSQLLISYNNGSANLQNASSAVALDSGEGSLKLYKDSEVITAVYEFTALGITIPLQYSFNGRSLLASVLAEGVKETDKNILVKFSILPFLGAGDMKEEGYILLPDGSGTLINFNNGKTDIGRLELSALYGDRTETLESPAEKTQPVLLSGFGFNHKTSGKAMFCYATEGAYGGSITSNVAGQETGLNYAYYTFLYRSYSNLVQMDNTWMSKAKLINDTENTGAERYTMAYEFLKSDELSLGGMADACRKYVYKSAKEIEETEIPLIADVYMGVKVKTNFLGIPYNALRPLTTLEQVKEISEELKENGISNQKLKLLGIDKDGAFGGKIKTKIKPAPAIGSIKQLNALEKAEGVSLYPEAEIISFNKGGGLFKSNKAAFNLLYDLIQQKRFTVASGAPTTDTPFNLSKASKIVPTAQKLLENIKSSGVEGVSSSGLGLAPYGDFSRKSTYRLEETGAAMKKAAEVIAENKSLMLNAPVAQLIEKADVISSVPVRSSRYPLTDGDVPFLQAVISGYSVYGGEQINLAGDRQESVLRAIETGSGFSIAIMYENYEKIKKTQLNGLYSAEYSTQKDWIFEAYNTVSKALEGTWGSPVKDIIVLNRDARVVCYENGKQIAVNYSDKAINYMGQTVEPKSYCSFSGGDVK